MKIGFVGLGNMGFGMAERLQNWLATQEKYSKSLLVWNRTKKEPPAGATFVESVAELAKSCSVVFSSLRDDAALKSVVEEFLTNVDGSLLPQVFCDSSTVSPATVKHLDDACDAKGVNYVSAQVLGRPDAAANGKLLYILGSSDAKSKAWIKELVEKVPLARGVLDVGTAIKAPALKLVANNMILGSIELLAEAMTLADANEIGRDVFKTLVHDPLFGSIVMSGYGGRMSDDQFDAKGGFPVTTALKDARLMKTLANERKVVMPTLDTAISHLESCESKNRGGLDWGSLVTVVREEGGRASGC